MATQNVLLAESFPTITDLTTAGVASATAKYYLMKLDANGNAILAAAGTDIIEGTLEEEAPAGSTCKVNTAGIAKVMAGGTIARGDRLTSGADGRAITTVTAGNYSIGRAREAGVAGQVVQMTIERWKV